MALGVDLYARYQTVTDWQAVRRHGVTFVYAKGTDGGGRAYVPADGLVRGATGVGLPVGLYHYAQLTPSPEAQADVLIAEVRRLGATGLPPALDLEDPHPISASSREFAVRFLRRLRQQFPAATLYANTSMLRAIGACDLGVPDVLIWAANHGPNDGVRHADRLAAAYPCRVDIHQYTSRGRVPGITGYVDLNESLTALIRPPRPEETTMRVQLARTAEDPTVWAGNGIQRRIVTSPQKLTNLQWWLRERFGQPEADVEIIGDIDVLGEPIGAIPKDPAADVVEMLNPAVVEAVHRSVRQFTTDQLAAIATAVADEQERRQAECATAIGAEHPEHRKS